MIQTSSKLTVRLTPHNAELLTTLKNQLGVSGSKSDANSILINLILSKFRDQILNLLSETPYSNPPTPKLLTPLENNPSPSRLPPINF